MILRARAVLPMIGPPIENGAVAIAGSRIRAVGRSRDVPAARGEEQADLGDVVLLPGLINAHCHLDYTAMAGEFQSPKRFIDWLKLITSTKAEWSAQDYQESWRSGAGMLLRTGTTTVADIEAIPQLLPEMWEATPLRVISLLEMISITRRRLPETVLQETLKKIESLQHHRCCAGLSPHAPYSTVIELVKRTAEVARRKRWLVCTHVAESQTEFRMFTRGEGDMYEWLEKSGREMTDCGLGSPVRHLERCGLLRGNLLATHANYLSRGDATLLAKRQVSVVHCPRSHAYFRHEPFRLRSLLRAGVNVCLGTDSLASVIKTRRQDIELDMFAEMQLLADRQPWLNPATLVRMATVNSAQALNRAGKIGQLSPRAMADVIAVPFAGSKKRIMDSVLEHRGPVCASLIDGAWACRPS
jgi:aminodeoxyfutalosine deaminase